MDSYCVQYYSRTLAAIENRKQQQSDRRSRLNFNYELRAIKVRMTDSLKRIDNVNMHNGLSLIVYVKAHSMKEAQLISRDFAETVLTLVSFTTMASCEAVKLRSIINHARSEALPAEFVAGLSEDREILGETRIINKAQLGAVFKAQDKSVQPEDSARIERTMIWLRKGISEENRIDQFLCYFFGMEVIACLLRDRLRFQKKAPKKWDGIKRILKDKLKFDDFDDINKARQVIVHGHKAINDRFLSEIRSYLDPMRKCLVFTVGNVIELDESVVIPIADRLPLRLKDEPWQVLIGKLVGLPADFDELIEDYPRFEIKDTGLHYHLDEEGNIQAELKPTHKFRCSGKGVFKPERAELRGQR